MEIVEAIADLYPIRLECNSPVCLMYAKNLENLMSLRSNGFKWFHLHHLMKIFHLLSYILAVEGLILRDLDLRPVPLGSEAFATTELVVLYALFGPYLPNYSKCQQVWHGREILGNLVIQARRKHKFIWGQPHDSAKV